ncbi:restriction endonuclease subunit S [Flavobacterium faecale]|uniref:restriction endonuclease subunit S n=1 Tax=Flavobacterium faecale TaxID=1355330 RepID=UPI003AAD5288
MKNKLPKNWIETDIETVADILDNLRKPVSSDERSKRIGDVPYYGATGQAGWINDYIFNEELVLVGEDGAPFFDKFKNVAYKISGKSWVNNHAHVLKGKNGISNDILLHFFNQFDYSGFVGGTTRLKLNQGYLKSIPFPLPPLAEQNRIVDKLDRLFAQLETIKTSMAKVPELLKDFRQQVLTQAVTGKLLKINQFTELGKLEIDIRTGPFGSALHKSDYIENGVSVINPSHINNGIIIPDTNVSISNEKYQKLKVYKLINNDVILGRRGEMGRAALYNESYGNCICGTGSIILRCGSNIYPKFLTFYLRSPFCIEYLNSNSVGTTMINLNQKIIKSLKVPNVSYLEQQEIVSRVESLFAKADAIEQQYKSLKNKIDTLPQAILHKAFKGELSEQLDTDGDASELLQSIQSLRAERGTRAKRIEPLANPTKKGRKQESKNKKLDKKSTNKEHEDMIASSLAMTAKNYPEEDEVLGMVAEEKIEYKS